MTIDELTHIVEEVAYQTRDLLSGPVSDRLNIIQYRFQYILRRCEEGIIICQEIREGD